MKRSTYVFSIFFMVMIFIGLAFAVSCSNGDGSNDAAKLTQELEISHEPGPEPPPHKTPETAPGSTSDAPPDSVAEDAPGSTSDAPPSSTNDAESSNQVSAKSLLEQTMDGECPFIDQLNLVKASPSLGNNAQAEIAFCREYPGEFVVAIHATGFPPVKSYWLSLNGWKGRPGNEELKKFNVTQEGEGYLDFATVKTDEQGEIRSLARTALTPSDYAMKFFIKQSDEPYSIVMKNDMVSLSIIINEAITIKLPDKLRGPKNLVEGKVKHPDTGNVFVFVHPLEIDSWFCQPIAVPDKEGSWAIIAYFGDEHVGKGEYFETVAIIGGEAEQFRQGQKVSSARMNELIGKYQSSKIIRMKRIE